MDQHNRSALAQKKAELQRRLQASAFYRQHVADWLELPNLLQQHSVPFEVTGFYWPQEFVSELPQQLADPETGRYLADRPLIADIESRLFSGLEQRYPSTNPLRYVPDMPYRIPCEPDAHAALQQIIGKHPPGTMVHFFYSRYAPELRVDLADILSNAALFFSLPEDCCLMTSAYQWILCRTLEDEWWWTGDIG